MYVFIFTQSPRYWFCWDFMILTSGKVVCKILSYCLKLLNLTHWAFQFSCPSEEAYCTKLRDKKKKKKKRWQKVVMTIVCPDCVLESCHVIHSQVADVFYRRTSLHQNCPRWLVMMNKNRAQAEVVVIQTSAPCASPLMLCVQSGQFWCGCSGLCVYALTAYVDALKHMFSKPSMPVIKMFKHRKWAALAIFSTDTGRLLGNTTYYMYKFLMPRFTQGQLPLCSH